MMSYTIKEQDIFLVRISVANRRKSRTGKSLELNLAEIFREESLRFEEQVQTESHKRPDFIFPSKKDYINPRFPVLKLNMLAAKTCCKDRWRQVISEAKRIEQKHLFTLQEGISQNQVNEMKESNISLVVPKPNIKKFPATCRKDLMDLTQFVELIRLNQQYKR